jgi:hypothetical protein
MDLSQFDTSKTSEKGVELVIINPATLEETDIKIRLAGTDSSYYRNQIKARAEQQLSKGQKKATTVDLDKSEREGCELLAACTLGWSGIEENGKAIDFSRDAAVDVYMRHKWLREQVDRFVGDRANFFPKPSKA